MSNGSPRSVQSKLKLEYFNVKSRVGAGKSPAGTHLVRYVCNDPVLHPASYRVNRNTGHNL
jgi:hypothetical protein